MEKVFGSPKAVGLRVKVKRSDGKVARGTIDKVNANGLVSVVFDPEYVGEWEDNFEYFSAKDIKPDYDAEGMKALMDKWRESTKTTAGPLGPMKHVKSFLTGVGRKRKTRKRTRKSGKRI